MTWWALLYGLSSLARYDPETWVAALDVDRSHDATSLEQLLDVAVPRIPELVSTALSEQSRSELFDPT
jgi:hypothetical protein